MLKYPPQISDLGQLHAPMPLISAADCPIYAAKWQLIGKVLSEASHRDVCEFDIKKN